MKKLGSEVLRLLGLLLVCVLALQLYFLGRIALMAFVAPESTSFQRSEMARLIKTQGQLVWVQAWVPARELPDTLKRAVVASEDASFSSHGGVDWAAVKSAWERNRRAADRAASSKPSPDRPTGARGSARLVGGSTISQQLAKNLFLSGERTTLRKAQEVIITFMLETVLGKSRILTIYLNSVEWGEGLFGAQAASRHYFHQNASQLSAASAARLAVMLPAPKRFERQPASAYILSRAAVIEARMGAVELP
jgi:monofunctional biosynthetic peptidoglycan transglycosylase